MANRFAQYAVQPAATNRFSRFAELEQADYDSVGGLAPDASPIDYAAQSFTASDYPPRAPASRGGGVLEQMQADGRLPVDGRKVEMSAPAVGPAPPQEPSTGFGRYVDNSADALKRGLDGAFERIIMPFIPEAMGGKPDTTNPEQQQWLSERGVGERAADAGAFALSAPVRAFTRGEYGAGDVATGLGFPNAGQSLAGGERDFVRANEPQLSGLQLAGEGLLGATGASMAPMMPRNLPRPVVDGAPPMPRRAVPPERVEPSFSAPPPPQAAPAIPAQPASLGGATIPPQSRPGVPAFGQPGAPVGPSPQTMNMPASNTARARSYVRDLDELGIPRFGPAIAQAAREGDGMGAFTRMVQGVPLAGRPLERGASDFYGAAVRAGDDIAGRYSREGSNPERVGETVRNYLEAFKEKPSIAREVIRNMPDDELAVLAERAPRDIGSLPTAAAAWYERAWRHIPVQFRRGGAQEDNPRLMGQMHETRKVLQAIHDENRRMMNRSKLSKYTRDPNSEPPPPGVIPTRSGGLYADAIPFRGGVIGKSIESILDGYWSGSLQTMRNIRSEIRRSESRMTDTEGNARNLANYEMIYAAIQKDMSHLMERIARMYETGIKAKRNSNEPEVPIDLVMAERFRAAKRDMDIADKRYREYKTALDDIKTILQVKTDMKMVDGIIAAATSRGRLDTNALLRIRQIAPDTVLDDIASGVFHRMGAPTGRAGAAAQEAGWSLGKAMSAWNMMPARARQLIWGHRPQHYQSLNKLFKSMEGMAEYEKMANTSKSGQHIIAALTAAGVGTAALSIAGLKNTVILGLGAYATARFLSSPLYVKWLTKTFDLEKAFRKGSMTPPAANAAVQRHRHALVRIVRADKSLDPETAARALRLLGATGDDLQQGDQPQH